MDNSKFIARVNELLVEETNQPLCWWYLSFADSTGFKGAVIVQAHGITTALLAAKSKRINPGGEVVAHPIPTKFKMPKKAVNRLLSEKDLQKFFGDIVGLDGKKR